MKKFPKTALIDIEQDGAWITIWFNSKHNRNALSEQLMEELSASLDAARHDKGIRGITIRGRHGVFCAGGDLKQFASGQKLGSPEHFKKLNRRIGDLFDEVQSMPQVVITFVEGAAIAGGLGLMCCGDIIVVTEDAKFSLTETMIGIVPAQIAPIIVARAGLQNARRLMLTGARFLGRQTPEYNLSDHVVKGAKAFESLETEIRKGVMKCAPGANELTKEILLATPHLNREAQKDFAAEKFADAILSDEGKEGIASFFEKRKPDWAK